MDKLHSISERVLDHSDVPGRHFLGVVVDVVSHNNFDYSLLRDMLSEWSNISQIVSFGKFVAHKIFNRLTRHGMALFVLINDTSSYSPESDVGVALFSIGSHYYALLSQSQSQSHGFITKIVEWDSVREDICTLLNSNCEERTDKIWEMLRFNYPDSRHVPGVSPTVLLYN